jgi:Sec-independent protein secretion pathway component TatC
MTIFAAPMVVLYGMSILIAWIVGLTRAKSDPDQID